MGGLLGPRSNSSFPSANGHVQVVRLLLKEKGIDFNTRGGAEVSTAVLIASRQGGTEILRLLLAGDGIDVKIKETESLCQPARYVFRSLGLNLAWGEAWREGSRGDRSGVASEGRH